MFVYVLILAFCTSYVHGSCPLGWVQHASSCYVYVKDYQTTWYHAKDFCKKQQAKLAEIESEPENTFLIDGLREICNRRNFWLGARDEDDEGVWEWDTTGANINLTFSGWGPGQPDDSTSKRGDGHTEDCLAVGRDYHDSWGDAACTLNNNFICEKIKTPSGSTVIG